MRLLKLGIYHATYLKNFYAARFRVKNEFYDVQHRALIEDCFGSSDFWTLELNKINYETTDIIANAEFLQKKWAHENSVAFNEKNWLFEITTAQIKEFRPDILLIADYSTFTPAFLRNLRRECPSIRLILGWCGAPYEDLSVFREWDIALSCVPEMVAEFRAQGIRSFHVNHAFAPRILEKINVNSAPKVNFSFVGSVLKQNKFHLERERLLLKLVESTDLQIWSEIKRPTSREKRSLFVRRQTYQFVNAVRRAGTPEKILNNLPLAKKAALWENEPNFPHLIDERIASHTHSPVFGIEMFQKLRDSRVVFNNHIDISPVSASNMRLFETTGVGACLLTDWKENLHELFEPDKEVLTYRSADECVEKINYILAHETERRAVAAAGQQRTLREHTFQNRAGQLDEIIRGVKF